MPGLAANTGIRFSALCLLCALALSLAKPGLHGSVLVHAQSLDSMLTCAVMRARRASSSATTGARWRRSHRPRRRPATRSGATAAPTTRAPTTARPRCGALGLGSRVWAGGRDLEYGFRVPTLNPPGGGLVRSHNACTYNRTPEARCPRAGIGGQWQGWCCLCDCEPVVLLIAACNVTLIDGTDVVAPREKLSGRPLLGPTAPASCSQCGVSHAMQNGNLQRICRRRMQGAVWRVLFTARQTERAPEC